MKRFTAALAAIAIALFPVLALAQSAVLPQRIVVSSCATVIYVAGRYAPSYVDSTGKDCPGPQIAISTAPLTAISGTQRGLSIASATALTVPSGATVAVIQAQGTGGTNGVCAYWQDDGTNPTNAAGQQLFPGQPMVYAVAPLTGFKAIAAAAATCTLTVSYYKYS